MNDQEGRPFDPPATKAETEDGSRLTPRFDRDGLVTAVVTDAASGELLMVAHMNDEALDLTIRTRVAHYWSRSRQSLWKKGETSGATQAVQEIRVDCDQDAIWLKVRADRPSETCHTHRASCFYRSVDPDGDGRALVFDPRLAVGAASDALRKTASPVAYDREHVAARLDEGKPAGSGAKPGAPEPSGRAAGSGADDESGR